MKPIIGIVSSINKDDNSSVIYEDIIKVIEKAEGEPIGLITRIDDEIGENVLKQCSGFLFQGGKDMNTYQFKILDYAYKNKISIMGICMGFELIATYFFGYGSVVRISDLDINTDIDHNKYFEDDFKKQIVHEISINKDSLLNKLFGDKMFVNSRHVKTITGVNKPFIISAISEDGLIEGIECINEDNFILGVQFHPENIDSMQPLFNEFINVCRNR